MIELFDTVKRHHSHKLTIQEKGVVKLGTGRGVLYTPSDEIQRIGGTLGIVKERHPLS